ncbi:MAG TPA: phosphoribosylglycinamide formyltransferase [Polyangiaceae bacterium]|nr:phosphoribosylglycinamide formyltransferase [Polyangiaceae bacterium]
MARLSLGVLVSGTGTNLQAILDAVADGRLDAVVRVVITNKADAPALERARAHGVPALTISHKSHATRDAFDAALVAALREHGVEWVVLAGFMRLLTPTMLDGFKNRIINIHPSLLPAFPGVDAQQQAFYYGVKVTGCTVHLVDEGTDTGPILMQRAVPVLDGDDVGTLRARILAEEHALLVETLSAIARGSLEVHAVENGRARARLGVE